MLNVNKKDASLLRVRGVARKVKGQLRCRVTYHCNKRSLGAWADITSALTWEAAFRKTFWKKGYPSRDLVGT